MKITSLLDCRLFASSPAVNSCMLLLIMCLFTHVFCRPLTSASGLTLNTIQLSEKLQEIGIKPAIELAQDEPVNIYRNLQQLQMQNWLMFNDLDVRRETISGVTASLVQPVDTKSSAAHYLAGNVEGAADGDQSELWGEVEVNDNFINLTLLGETFARGSSSLTMQANATGASGNSSDVNSFENSAINTGSVTESKSHSKLEASFDNDGNGKVVNRVESSKHGTGNASSQLTALTDDSSVSIYSTGAGNDRLHNESSSALIDQLFKSGAVQTSNVKGVVFSNSTATKGLNTQDIALAMKKTGTESFGFSNTTVDSLSRSEIINDIKMNLGGPIIGTLVENKKRFISNDTLAKISSQQLFNSSTNNSGIAGLSAGDQINIENKADQTASANIFATGNRSTIGLFTDNVVTNYSALVSAGGQGFVESFNSTSKLDIAVAAKQQLNNTTLANSGSGSINATASGQNTTITGFMNMTVDQHMSMGFANASAMARSDNGTSSASLNMKLTLNDTTYGNRDHFAEASGSVTGKNTTVETWGEIVDDGNSTLNRASVKADGEPVSGNQSVALGFITNISNKRRYG